MVTVVGYGRLSASWIPTILFESFAKGNPTVFDDSNLVSVKSVCDVTWFTETSTIIYFPSSFTLGNPSKVFRSRMAAKADELAGAYSTVDLAFLV